MDRGSAQGPAAARGSLTALRRLLPRELHDSDRPSATAQAVTLYRALELRRPVAQRIVSDPFAPLFLTAGTRALLRPLALATPLRDLAAQHDLGGLSTYVLCRHRFIDAHLLRALDDGTEQVLILGAGYDSRAYRFAAQLAGRPVYEVDLPPLSQRKAAIVAAHPAQFRVGSITRVEIDFRTQTLTERLDAAGFARGKRTFVVWEGVAPYLDSAAVDATLSALGSLCGAGSTLALDLWDGTGGPGPLAPLRRLGAQAIALIGEPVTFGVAPTAVSELLGAHRFGVIDLANAGELTDRYATAGRQSFESLYVVAAELVPVA
jgi:methyltransferase (TIGR00027 family)